MRLLFHDPALPAGFEAPCGAGRVELTDLLRESDFVTLHVPLTPETRGLIGEGEFAMMKPTAILINASRGPVVDQEALCQALRERRIEAAGLDVYEAEPLPADDPLLALDNVVLTPHVGSGTDATRILMAQEAAENILAALVEGRPRNVVNPDALGRFRQQG
jgi:gluconate 2-dehydrogenase